ncbi:MAG: hypothetical protein ABIG39_02785 [Candidatus Micrarchaeota archaeon]
MVYQSSTSTDIFLDVGVLAVIIGLIPKEDIFYVLLLSVISITIVVIESKIRGFKLTGYLADGVNAFRPMYWTTAILLLILYYRPIEGITLWEDTMLSFFVSTMLVFLALILVAYRAAASN